MTVALIVSAYKDPALLGRLVARLDGRPCAIHVDAKVDAAPFVAAVPRPAGAHWLPRHVCHWGMFGHVAASLEGLRWFLGTGCGHVVLLTGQCYPLRPMDELEAWLDALGDASVLSHDPLPHPRWMNGGLDRVERHHVRLFGRAWHLRLGRRAMPGGLRPYGGSSYWCLSRAAARLVVDAVDRDPALVEFFRRVWIPDETFFQTILANSPLGDRLVNDDVHHIEWVPHQPSPKVIIDPGPALASGKWFARKFADQATLDAIDAHIAGRSGARADAAARVAEDVEL